MTSGWSFGGVQFPVAPQRVIYKIPASIKKTPVMFESPWIMSMGPDAIEIALEGEIFETTKSLATIYTDYGKKLRRYAQQKQVIDEIFLDESPTSNWSKSGVSATVGNATASKVRLNQSLRVNFADADNSVYREFSSNKNLSDKNFISIWVLGTGSEKFRCTLYNETFANKEDGYRFYIQCSTAGWNQTFIAISSADNTSYVANTVGAPSGWNTIRTIVIDPSNFNPGSQLYYFDVLAGGQGWKLDGPGTRYDGIYSIANFQLEESPGNIQSFKYSLNLMRKNEMFGEV